MKSEKNRDGKQELRDDFYQIVILGIIDQSRIDWFSSMGFSAAVAQSAVGSITILTGRITDQSHLRGFMNKLWDLNFQVLQVQSIKAMKNMGDQTNE